MKISHLLIAATLAATTTTAQAEVTPYTDPGAFGAVAGPLAVEDFESYSTPINMGTSFAFASFTVTNSNNDTRLLPGSSEYNVNGTQFLYTNLVRTSSVSPGIITFTFDVPITAFGANFFSLNNNFTRTIATVGGVTFDPLPISPDFLGFVSDTPFTTLSFSIAPFQSPLDTIGIDNLVFSAAVPAVPEPATWAMLIAGFGAAGTALRRRRRAVAAVA